MPRYSSKRRVQHRAEQMFNLVADVERYPEFVPLCHALKIRQRTQNADRTETIVADMTVSFKLVKETFTSEVTLDRANGLINVRYLRGPFSNLDSAFRAYMRAELKRIQHEVGQTMVYVTHDQVEAMGMADRIAVMDRGKLQQYGSPDDLYERPANTFVARFIGSVLNNFIAARYADGALHIGDGSVELGELRGAFESRDSASGLTATIRPERVRVVAAGSPDATISAQVTLVEPLGPKDVVHLEHQGTDVRVVLPPDARPAIGSALGLIFDPAQVHVFDDDTGLAVR